MERYELNCGAVIYKEENNIVPSENSVVFNVQVFKESSGKYYTSFRLILEKYTKTQIDSMQRSGTEDEKDFCYHLISDLVGYHLNLLYQNDIILNVKKSKRNLKGR